MTNTDLDAPQVKLALAKVLLEAWTLVDDVGNARSKAARLAAPLRLALEELERVMGGDPDQRENVTVPRRW